MNIERIMAGGSASVAAESSWKTDKLVLSIDHASRVVVGSRVCCGKRAPC